MSNYNGNAALALDSNELVEELASGQPISFKSDIVECIQKDPTAFSNSILKLIEECELEAQKVDEILNNLKDPQDWKMRFKNKFNYKESVVDAIARQNAAVTKITKLTQSIVALCYANTGVMDKVRKELEIKSTKDSELKRMLVSGIKSAIASAKNAEDKALAQEEINNEIKAKAEKLQCNSNEIFSRLGIIEENIDEIEEDVDELQESDNRQNELLQSHDENIDEIEEDVDELQESDSKQNELLQSHDENIDEIEEDVDELQESDSRQNELLQSHDENIDEIEEDVDELQESDSRQNELLQSHDENIDEIEENVEENKSNIEKNESKIEKLFAEIELLKIANDESQAKVKQAKIIAFISAGVSAIAVILSLLNSL